MRGANLMPQAHDQNGHQAGYLLGTTQVTRTAAIVVALPLAFLVFYFTLPPDQSLLQTDSESYLAFAAERTGGYPLFLAALKPFASDIHGYVTAQLILFASSAALLGWSIYRASGSVLFSAAAQALLLGNPEVNKVHFTILTESLFLSLSALVVTSAICYLRKPSAVLLASMSIAAAYAAIVRPTGLAFVPIVLLLVLIVRRRTNGAMRHAVVAFASIVSTFAAEALYYRSQHDGPRRSLLPIHSFAKAGMVAVADADVLMVGAPKETQALYRALETGLQPMRRLIRQAPSAAARCRLAANYESYVQYQFARPERSTLLSAEGEWPLTMIGLRRIAHAPVDYLRQVGDNFYCLWTIWAATNSEKDDLRGYLQQHRPIPFDAEMFASLATAPSPAWVYLVRPVMLTIALALAAAGVAVLWAALRGRPVAMWLSVAGICGLMVHGSLLLTAFAGIATPRYTLALWVPMCIGILAAVLWAAGTCNLKAGFVWSYSGLIDRSRS